MYACARFAGLACFFLCYIFQENALDCAMIMPTGVFTLDVMLVTDPFQPFGDNDKYSCIPFILVPMNAPPSLRWDHGLSTTLGIIPGSRATEDLDSLQGTRPPGAPRKPPKVCRYLIIMCVALVHLSLSSSSHSQCL